VSDIDLTEPVEAAARAWFDRIQRTRKAIPAHVCEVSAA